MKSFLISIFLALLIVEFLFTLSQASPLSASDFCVGAIHSCFLNANSWVKCFGNNGSGQLGYEDIKTRGDEPNEMGGNLPLVNLGNNFKPKSISCGGFHTCVIDDKWKVKCFGSNSDGQLGLGVSVSTVGASVGQMGDDLKILNFGKDLQPMNLTLGSYHTCVRFSNRKIKCFGKALNGAIGYEDQYARGAQSIQIGDALPFVNLGTNLDTDSIHASNTGDHTCAILTGLKVKCWGKNNSAQLGYGDTNDRGSLANTMGDNLPFVDLGTESRVIQVQLGAEHTCVININVEIICWGNNANGRLGIGSTLSKINKMGSDLVSIPYDNNGKAAIQISAGFDHTCMLLSDKVTAKCVGDNQNGQLGQGDVVERGNSVSTIPKNIRSIDLGEDEGQIQSIHCGMGFTCIRFMNSNIKCFGKGSDGSLGYGSKSTVGISLEQMGDALPNVDLSTTFQQEYPAAFYILVIFIPGVFIFGFFCIFFGADCAIDMTRAWCKLCDQ